MADIGEASGIECQTDPKEFDLILGNQRYRAGDADNWQNVGQIVSATGNHCCRRSRSRRSYHIATVLMPERQLFEIGIEPNLSAKSCGKGYQVVPIVGKLGDGEIPARQEREDAKIDCDESPECEGAA